VAIIGGGCAAMAAAFELSRPIHRGRYAITVYQLGWRLGGKGASGRGLAGRIEEHGLHLWMGFYENAFRLMRECYAELARDPRRYRIADWRDAFVAEPFIGVGAARGRRNWLACFPPADGLPGDPLRDYNPFTLTSYLIRTAVLMQTLVASALPLSDAVAPVESAAAELSSAEIEGIVKRYLKFGLMSGLAGAVGALRLFELGLRRLAPQRLGALLPLLESLGVTLRAQLEQAVARDPDLQEVWEVIDLLLAFQRGALRFNLLNDPRGFDCLNGYDTREWLRLNGAAPASVNSDLMRGLYDLAMAYEDGDPARPRMAAGLGLRACLRMFFTYRGAMMWKMKAGMGDVVFAPFYQVLRRRGVAFKFFHRLTNVRLGRDSSSCAPHVAALEFDLQARVRDGEYQPLVEIAGLPCWPARPDYAQLLDGERARREGWEFESHWESRRARRLRLRVGRDFDLVILAIGLGAVPHVCREIVATNQRWAAMVRKVKTVPTMAFQLWLRKDMEELGWDHLPTTMSGFPKPFDTWADMRHLLDEEAWPKRPRSLLYFCGAMPETNGLRKAKAAAYVRAARRLVKTAAADWITANLGLILPGSLDRHRQFRWELLVDPATPDGIGPRPSRELLDTQFWTANINPSDRYVLSIPGSVEYRISPLDYDYDNLTIAGDWTECGLNLGCVEAAVMSGRLAAHAIAQSPALEDIIGYDHP